MGDYYSAQEFADIFGVNYRTITNAIRDGHVRAFKIGESKRSPFRIPKSEVLRVEVEGIRKNMRGGVDKN